MSRFSSEPLGCQNALLVAYMTLANRRVGLCELLLVIHRRWDCVRLREDRQRLRECVRKARDRGCSDAAHPEGDRSTRHPRRGAHRRAVLRTLEWPVVTRTKSHARERFIRRRRES